MRCNQVEAPGVDSHLPNSVPVGFARSVQTQPISFWGLWQLFPGEGLPTPPIGQDKASLYEFISLMAYEMWEAG